MALVELPQTSAGTCPISAYSAMKIISAHNAVSDLPTTKTHESCKEPVSSHAKEA